MSFFRFVSDCDAAAAPTEPAASATVAPDPVDDTSPPLPRPAYRTSWRGQFRPATVSALQASVDSGAGIDALASGEPPATSADSGAVENAANALSFFVGLASLVYVLRKF